MAFATTLATGVGAAIGGKYDAARDQLIFAGFYGYEDYSKPPVRCREIDAT
jgi:hypothetical protein